MRPMSEFDPGRPAKVHDRAHDSTILWQVGWAARWRSNARPRPDGTVWFDGQVLDGWEPVAKTASP